MKKVFTSSLLLALTIPLLSLTLIGGEQTSSWNEKMYEAHTWKSFYQLEASNKRIDFMKPDYALLNAAIFYASNEIRAKKKRKALKYDKRLMQSSNLHSTNMMQKDFFSHKGKLKGMKTPSDRIHNFAPEYNLTAENLAKLEMLHRKPKQAYNTRQNGLRIEYFNPKNDKIYTTYSYKDFAQACVAAWMRSPGHRDNLMLHGATHLGCGVLLEPITFEKGEVYDLPMLIVTQNFGAQ